MVANEIRIVKAWEAFYFYLFNQLLCHISVFHWPHVLIQDGDRLQVMSHCLLLMTQLSTGVQSVSSMRDGERPQVVSCMSTNPFHSNTRPMHRTTWIPQTSETRSTSPNVALVHRGHSVTACMHYTYTHCAKPKPQGPVTESQATGGTCHYLLTNFSWKQQNRNPLMWHVPVRFSSLLKYSTAN